MPALAAIVVSAASCVLCIIGMAIPYWTYIEAGGVTAHAGLWQGCGAGTCLEFTSVPSSLKAVRAMEILGMFLVAGAVVLGVLKLIAMKDKTVLLRMAGVCAIVAAVLMMIGVIIYAAKVKKDFYPGTDLHAGFALCIIAALASIVAGVLFFINRE